MRFVYKLFTVAFLICLFVTNSEANYKYINGYYYYNGYGHPYTYNYYYGGYSYGTYYNPGYYYTQSYYAPYIQQPVQQQVTNNPPANWKAEVIKYAQQKDDADLYWKVVSSLGIQPQGVYSGSYATPQYSITPQGSSLYGYSTKTLLELYGGGNVDTALQAFARATDGTRQLHSDAVGALGQTVNQLSSNQVRVLTEFAKATQTSARGEAAAKALLATQESSARVESTTTQVRPMPQADVNINANAVNNTAAVRWAQAAQKNCASCHLGAKVKGGFDLTLYGQLNDDQKRIVIDRLTTSDLSKRMPRDSEGKAANLSLSDLQALLGY